MPYNHINNDCVLFRYRTLIKTIGLIVYLLLHVKMAAAKHLKERA